MIKQYHQLWTIEKAFRISKHDLQIRPIYHQLKRRIEAHICIAFAACKIYKELERQLKEKKTGQSPEQVLDILKTIMKVEFKTPYSNKIYQELILNTDEQKALATHFNLNSNLGHPIAQNRSRPTSFEYFFVCVRYLDCDLLSCFL